MVMDKRCKDCKYKVYIDNDINEVWGFCSCMDKDLRDVTNKYHKELNKYSAKYGIVKDSNNMTDHFSLVVKWFNLHIIKCMIVTVTIILLQLNGYRLNGKILIRKNIYELERRIYQIIGRTSF